MITTTTWVNPALDLDQKQSQPSPITCKALEKLLVFYFDYFSMRNPN